MRLRQDARIAHLVFMRAEDLSQILDFLVHAVEHLANGVHFHFAAFEPLQREADGQVFGQLHDHRLVRLGVRRLRRQACECLFQRVLRAASPSLSWTESSTQRPDYANSATAGCSRNGSSTATAYAPKVCTRADRSASSPTADVSSVI